MISPTACGVCQVHHVHQNTIIQKPFSEVVDAPKRHHVHDKHHFSIIPKYQYLKKCLENGVYDVLRYTKYMIIAFSVKYPTRARRKVYGKTPYGVFGVLIRARSLKTLKQAKLSKEMVSLIFPPLPGWYSCQ